jgi:peptidoglycan/xylan/chitin deacetylase (PgdA/CDA1 family)
MQLRWVVKRTLKWTVEWGMALSGLGLLYRHTSTFQEGFRILTYHRISDRCEDSHTLKTDHFQAHMQYLSDHHPVIALPAVVERMMNGLPPEAGSVAITFDDGYEDCAGIVGEILDRHRLPATFYVVTGVLDGEMIPANGGRFMTWADVKHMASAGFAIGSHTVRHSSLGAMTAAEVEQELAHSRNRILQETGRLPDGLAYPYGTVRDVSPVIAAIAKKVGYRHAVTAIHGLTCPGCNPFLLPRTSITAGDGLRTFRMIMKGYLDPWVFVDTWAYRFQRPHQSWS